MYFDLGIGKGLIDGNNIQCYIFGQPFGFSCPSGFGNSSTMNIVDPTATFNLSGLTVNHEVITALTRIYLNPSEQSPPFTITFNWYNPSGTKVFTWSHGFLIMCASSSPCVTWVAYSYIGYYGGEIYFNGTYRVEGIITESGGSSYSIGSLYFYVTGAQTPQIGQPGYIWIQDEGTSLGHLRFVGESGTVHQCKIYGAGNWSLNPGYLYVHSNTNELIYTDNLGNYVGITKNATAKPHGNPGYIWIEGEYLYHVGNDGIVYQNQNDF
jgi:hypothetical protein